MNAERNELWKKIAALTNEKYGAELGNLTVEQIKKLCANYKRKYPSTFWSALKSVKMEDETVGQTEYSSVQSPQIE